MTSTCSIKEAEAQLPALLRKVIAQKGVVSIQEKSQIVAYVISAERLESMLETAEILANPEAMKAIEDARAGRTKYYPLSVLDDED